MRSSCNTGLSKSEYIQKIGILKTENKELKSIKESLEIALAEQERIVGEVIDELLTLKGGHC